jgi:FtsH-binding integral membrane protein
MILSQVVILASCFSAPECREELSVHRLLLGIGRIGLAGPSLLVFSLPVPLFRFEWTISAVLTLLWSYLEAHLRLSPT